ncbi:hypothetical protein GOODEAATRI_000271 [Goodea atripinnis]|uniref:Uncharacterized protein n=1 Tax=Goodea atripinnis TaxID=208336 RepID=A0ABV0N902_9TELE
MDSLTEGEIAQIATLQMMCITCFQRDAGIRRLSHHFQWFEFSGDRLSFHQAFVYDVAMFTTERGFSWANVIRSAVLAKDIFPQLHGKNKPLCNIEHLPNLTPVHRHVLTQYLIDTCISRRRLFQVVVGGVVEESVAQKHLEVQLPPTPCPLAQTIMELVQSAVRTAEGQILGSLSQEASLLSDILQLKLQQEALATGRHHNTASSPMAATKAKKQKQK